MLDPLPKLIVELRADTAVKAIVNGRVRGFEPEPPALDAGTGAVIRDGDARGPGKYVAFVVLVTLGGPRMPTLPVQEVPITARCYGRSIEEAAQLWAAVSDALHFRGPRTYSNGLGIYQSHELSGGNPDRDPDTQQPLYIGTFNVVATTQALPMA